MPFTEYDKFDGRDDAQEPGGEGIRPSGNGASCKSEPRVPARKGRLWMKSRPFMALFLLAAFLLLLLMIWNFSTLFSGFGGNHWYDGRCCGGDQSVRWAERVLSLSVLPGLERGLRQGLKR